MKISSRNKELLSPSEKGLFPREKEQVDQARLRSTDGAQVWAEEFAKKHPEIDQDEMIGWFANCAETAKQLAEKKTGGGTNTPGGWSLMSITPRVEIATAERLLFAEQEREAAEWWRNFEAQIDAKIEVLQKTEFQNEWKIPDEV